MYFLHSIPHHPWELPFYEAPFTLVLVCCGGVETILLEREKLRLLAKPGYPHLAKSLALKEAVSTSLEFEAMARGLC